MLPDVTIYFNIFLTINNAINKKMRVDYYYYYIKFEDKFAIIQLCELFFELNFYSLDKESWMKLSTMQC